MMFQHGGESTHPEDPLANGRLPLSPTASHRGAEKYIKKTSATLFAAQPERGSASVA